MSSCGLATIAHTLCRSASAPSRRLGPSQKSLTCGAVLLIGLLTTVGCGGSDFPEGIPIRGTVTYNGEPVTQGSVRYYPVKRGEGREAIGFIKPDGTFELHTSRSIPGVLPGEYRIAVIAREGMIRPDGSDHPSSPDRTTLPTHPRDRPAQTSLIPRSTRLRQSRG